MELNGQTLTVISASHHWVFLLHVVCISSHNSMECLGFIPWRKLPILWYLKKKIIYMYIVNVSILTSVVCGTSILTNQQRFWVTAGYVILGVPTVVPWHPRAALFCVCRARSACGCRENRCFCIRAFVFRYFAERNQGRTDSFWRGMPLLLFRRLFWGTVSPGSFPFLVFWPFRIL